MLFNKKLLVGLSNLVGVILVLALLLNVGMYVWAFFATPPLALFDVTQGIVSYYFLLNKLVTLVFFFIITGVFVALVKGSKLQDGFKK